MFKVKWDLGHNSIILTSESTENSIQPPRPVYTQELRLLKFDGYYSFPTENVIICWCVDRNYYYDGQLIAEVKGGDIYNAPEVLIPDECSIKKLQPVDISYLVERNKEALFTLENEAMDFIKDQYELYSGKVSDFVVAFSGGKDSQVILDLVTRVLPVDAYKVLFTDTGMELDQTYQTLDNTEEIYKKKFPGFKLERAASEKKSVDMWQSYGPPSRINRWCCSVLKTALFGRKMKELLETDKQPKVVVFEGVRANESNRRSGYSRVGEGVKHINITNCRAILKWNTSEIFLYMIARQIFINPAYKAGLTRVGCGICPFASEWSDFIINKLNPSTTREYVKVIENMAQNMGITKQEKINDYVASGNWKKNAGGKGLVQDASRIDLLSKEPHFVVAVSNPKTNWKTWLSTVATSEIYISPPINNESHGEFRFEDRIVKFELIQRDNGYKFTAYNVTNQVFLISLLTKTFIKSAYCEKCGVCEVDCPTGSLVIGEEVCLNKKTCVNCNNCYSVNSKGCLIANRRLMYEGGATMKNSNTKTSGIDKYSTFGIRDTSENPWMNTFFAELDNWFVNGYGGLGPKQIPAMLAWLREAGLVDKKDKKVTSLANMLKPIYDRNPLLVWQIIWVNLSFDSPIVNWFVSKLRYGVNYNRITLLEELKEEYPNLNDTTLGNPIGALLNTFSSTPLGCLLPEKEFTENCLFQGVLTKSGNAIKEVTKFGTDNISSIAVAYLLYKYAENNDAYEMTVSNFYESDLHGPKTVFNLSQDKFLNTLRTLMNRSVLSADLLGGLDNIHLSKDYSSLQILEMLL